MQGNILDANPNFLRLVGYTLPEVKGRHHSMFAEPEFAKSREYRDFWADLNDGQFKSGRFRRLGKLDAESDLHTADARAEYYLCGPEGWMLDTREKLEQMGVARERIHLELFATGDVQ